MNKINTIIYSILFILVVFLILNGFMMREYTKTYKYSNETIIVKIWALYEPKKAFKDINQIYLDNNDLIMDEKEEYLNNLVKEYLDKNHYNKYIINMDNTIRLSDNEFRIGLPDALDDLKVTKVIKAKNKCISSYIKGKSVVTVISDKECEKIAHTLLSKDINEELKYINSLKNVDAIFNIDGEFIKSNNFKKYE
ncbi:MAG: hypothetical protein J6G98_04810 [Bacilli bacterium]|nr:hypothetical protein [Bacilli bacterium]